MEVVKRNLKDVLHIMLSVNPCRFSGTIDFSTAAQHGHVLGTCSRIPKLRFGLWLELNCTKNLRPVWIFIFQHSSSWPPLARFRVFPDRRSLHVFVYGLFIRRSGRRDGVVVWRFQKFVVIEICRVFSTVTPTAWKPCTSYVHLSHVTNRRKISPWQWDNDGRWNISSSIEKVYRLQR